MKYKILISTILVFLTCSVSAQDYYEGFEDGTKNGYNTVNGGYQIGSTSKVGSYSIQSNTDGDNRVRSGKTLGVTGVWKSLIRSEGGSYADLDLYAAWRPVDNKGYRIQYYPAGTDNPKFNIVKVGSGTLASSSPDFGINTWIELIMKIESDGTITATAVSGDQNQTIQVKDSSLYTQDGYIGARHYDSPGYVDYFSYSSIDDNPSICDIRGSFNECISNSIHNISGQEFNISSVFRSESSADFEALERRATVNVKNSSMISGLWKGSFDILSGDNEKTHLKTGARLRPHKGRITIG